MNHLTDNQLIQSLENLVRREREILNDVLLHLREIDRRKLFSKLGFTSLFDYATKQLKYSPDQAGRRIAAMRLLRDMPEAESKVIDGSLSFSTLAQAHWHFKKNEHTREEKREVLAKLENATKKQTAAILKQEDKVRYSFDADAATEAEVERLRGLNPHLTFDQLMKKVFQIALEKLDPAKKIERAEVRLQKKLEPKTETNAQAFTSAGKIDGAVELTKGTTFEKAISASKVLKPEINVKMRVERPISIGKVSRYIPAEVKRAVWRNANGRCIRCCSTFALEYDHIVPFAKGGKSSIANLQLLCKSCNIRRGVEVYGASQMNRFTNPELN